ncbi:cation-translocating P-type ATPase [Mycoplasmopsis gallinarum]
MDNNLEQFKQNGLTEKEVEAKLIEFGENTLTKSKKVNPIVAFFRQFMDPMVILLLIAAAISLGLAIYEHIKSHKSQTELIVSYIEPAIILLVVSLNSMLGAYQEVKSDQAVRALAKLNETNATVKRDGIVKVIPANLLVPGDLIILNAGDVISADCRILEASNLAVVESSLTGESLAVEKIANFNKAKDSILAQNNHLLFSGTYVTNGKALAIVEFTGNKTEIGKINESLQNQKKSSTPLQDKLNRLGKVFGIGGIVLLFVSLIMQILLNNIYTGVWDNWDIYTSSLVTAISLAVAAIPEGLITFTTVLLSIGVKKMTKDKGLVKNLLAVETLGSVSIICSDKTGTLTENKMTVVDAFYNNLLLSEAENKSEFKTLAKYLTLANDAHINFDSKNESFNEVGDPTETGLLRFAYDLGIYKDDLLKSMPLLSTLTFDSDRKMMSVLVDAGDYNLMITKGAPDVILKHSKVNNLTEIEQINKNFATKTYRVLAVGIKKVAKEQKTINFADESNLDFVGLVAMVDPPRKNVAQSIEKAKLAGVKTVMITGDHLDTAKAIASNLGIYNENDLAITGLELSQMSDQELKEKVKLISVYARVNPTDKLRIVKAWQSHNKVVAMTGDGVNDAPALKASDIGCAMGITGTDVSKQAADLILVDDNFNTIVNSIQNGRLIFDKIKVVILNLLVSSLTEILVMLIGMVAFFFAYKNHFNTEFYIFGASQLLWINLLTHGIPAIALGLVDSGKNVMNRPPYDKKESLFARGMGWNLIFQSVVLSTLTLIAYVLGAEFAIQNNLSVLVTASTTAFITMGVAASLNSINLMSDKSIFISSLKKYWLVWLAALSSTFLTLFVVLVPDISLVFRMSGNLYQNSYLLWMPILLGLGLTLANELWKLIKLTMKVYQSQKA